MNVCKCNSKSTKVHNRQKLKETPKIYSASPGQLVTVNSDSVKSLPVNSGSLKWQDPVY